MSIMFFCLREQILASPSWDQIVDLLYSQAKDIPIEMFYGFFLEVFKNVKFYISPYHVDPKLVNRNTDFTADPLAKIVEE
jgi:hypothetical protein